MATMRRKQRREAYAARLIKKEGQMDVQDRHHQQIATLEREAIVAELAETIELQVSKLESLREEVHCLLTERTQLETELHMARAWIRELAAELQQGDARSEPGPSTLRGRLQGNPA
jgi:hypothetical protein